MSHEPASVDLAFYELRIYEVVQGRLAGLRKQMDEDVPPLFKRHGLHDPLTFYEGFSGPFGPVYGYLLRWPSLDERMNAWGNFYSDPEWIAAQSASYVGEQRVERAHITFMRASVLWEKFRGTGAELVGGLYELRWHDTVGVSSVEAQDLVGSELARMQLEGARVLGVFEPIMGACEQRLVSFIAWPDSATLQRCTAVDPQSHQARTGLPYDSFVLRPTERGCARENFASHPKESEPLA